MIRKLLHAVTVGTILSLVAVGCGGGDVDPAEGDAAAETPEQSPESSEAAGASELYAELADMSYEERIATIEERAAEEGTVLLYSSRDSDLLDAFSDKFNELYPDITLQYISGDGDELYSRIQQEGAGGNAQADVIMIGYELTELANDGMLVDNHPLVIPESYPESGFDDYYVSFGPQPMVMAWNTNLVDADEAPSDWDDLLDPKWKGKIAIDYGPDDMIATMVSVWGEEETRTYLDELMDNDPIIRKGHSNITQLLAAGEFPIAAELFTHRVAQYISDGAPIDWAAADPIPNSGSYFSIAENAPHPYAAALLANFFASEEGAAVYAADGRLALAAGIEPLYPRTAELIGDPRLPDVDLFQQVESLQIAQQLVEEYITPAYTGVDE